jgi:uncharacterized membrane protein
MKIKHTLYHFSLVGLSLIICLDLLMGTGEPATFDGPIHITNIAQFHNAITQGEFPVQWANNFSNYGSPIPIVAQQFPNYLGALIMLLTQDPLLSYKIMISLAYVLTSSFLFIYLKRHTSLFPAFAGAALFTFSAYRLTNLYIRGAGPELMSIMWLPLILIGIDKIVNDEKHAHILLGISLVGLLLTHPLIFVVSQVFILPYCLFRLLNKKHKGTLAQVVMVYMLSIMIGSYYLIPLVAEMKYFVISKKVTQLIPDQFLSWQNFFNESWRYASVGDVFVRENRLQFGLLESLLLLSLIPLTFYKVNRQLIRTLPFWLLIIALVAVFMTTTGSQWFYFHVPFLDSIQFPWRFLSVLIFFPPIIFALWLDKCQSVKLQIALGSAVILALAVQRIPQAYGKNYTLYPATHYSHTVKNLYFDEMNTLWTGSTHQYPKRPAATKIIEGEGDLKMRQLKNSYREYNLEARTPLRIVDYTFYFPGWQVVLNDQPVEIEFQDEAYRGIITYRVPPGTHTAKVTFKPTKIRLVGQLLSLSGLLLAFTYAIARHRNKRQSRK